jgi:hypothetical protein
LEITFHAKIATVDSTDCIEGYCTNPKESIIKYTSYLPPQIMTQISDIIKDAVEILKNLNLNLDDLYKESSPTMRPKPKSSKLIAILRDIETTTSQTGN